MPGKHDVPSAPDFDWVREYPADASVTELEIYLAALARPAEALEKSFFYFRSNQFLRCYSLYVSVVFICIFALLSFNQSKQIYIAPCVASESEARDGRD